MSEILRFGALVLVVAAGLFLALGTYKLTERFPLPAPALFLLAAAAISDVFPGLAQHVSISTVERIAVVALIVILFDGGMHVGARRFRGSAVPISILGVLGTFATAGVMAVFAHALLETPSKVSVLSRKRSPKTRRLPRRMRVSPRHTHTGRVQMPAGPIC